MMEGNSNDGAQSEEENSISLMMQNNENISNGIVIFGLTRSYHIRCVGAGFVERKFPKIFMHSNYEYHLKEAKYTKNFGWRGYYACAFVRRRQCMAKLILSQYHDKFYPRCDQSNHTCSVQVILTETTAEIEGDVKDEMKLLVEAKSLANMTSSAYQIADEMLKEINEKYKSNKIIMLSFLHFKYSIAVGYAGMTRNQLRDYVYNVRRLEFQDWENAIRSPPLI